MVQTIEQGDPWGRIGSGLGKGFGQGAGDQFQRNMLASGIERIQRGKEIGVHPETGQKQYAPYSDLEKISQFYRLPGGAEQAQFVLPYLRNRAAIDEAAKASTIPSTETSVAKSVEPAFEIERRINTPESIRERAAIRAIRNPAQFQTLQSAIDQEESDTQKEMKNIENVNADFDKILAEKLQKGGKETYKDVLGDLQQSFKKQAEDAVISGKMTDKQAARKYGDQALEFAKSRQKLKEVGTSRWFSGGSRQGKKENLSEIKKDYKQHGRLEEFKNDLVTYNGMSDPAASWFTRRPSEQAESAIKNATTVASKAKGIFSYDHIANKLLDAIQDDDSLLGIAFELEQNGLSGDRFMSAMQRKYDEGKTSLNKRQADEFKTPRNFRPNLSDLYYFALGGMK